MSTTAVPVTRTLAIAADLLPVEITDARRTRRIRWRAVAVVVVFAVLLGAGYAAAIGRASAANRALRASQDRVDQLTTQQRRYSEVVRVQAESQAIRTQLAALLGNDLEWAPLLASLQRLAPTGVRVTSVSGALLSGKPAAGKTPAATAGTRAVGTLVIGGSSPTKIALAAYLDALSTVAGLANPVLANVSQHDGAQQFTVQVDITDAILSGRWRR
jgi:hypothetical protein